MGTRWRVARAHWCTASVPGDRFEGLLIEPDTMGVVPRTEGLVFLASPRLAPWPEQDFRVKGAQISFIIFMIFCPDFMHYSREY